MPPDIPFSTAIRERTRSMHVATEGSAFIDDLVQGRGSRTGYTALVGQQYFVYQALEAVAAKLQHDAVAGAFISPLLTRGTPSRPISGSSSAPHVARASPRCPRTVDVRTRREGFCQGVMVSYRHGYSWTPHGGAVCPGLRVHGGSSMRGSVSGYGWRAIAHLWMRFSSSSWRRLPIADDTPHVHAAGSYPDRILIVGDGASAGAGVLTHDLGLPGHLARAVSNLTGRATDVDISVSTNLTAVTARKAISGVRLSLYDVVLVSVGMNEALDFERPALWRTGLASLLDLVQQDSPASTRIVVLSIPYFSRRSPLPRLLARAVDRQAAKLNAESEQVIAGRGDATFHHFRPGDLVESDGAHAYNVWAIGIAPTVADSLAPSWSRARRDEPMDEAGRQEALQFLGLMDMPPDAVLDGIATTTRDLFGTPMAAVTFIGDDRQTMAAAIGAPSQDRPRLEAFCNYTVRHPEHFVIEDAQIDTRFRDFPVVTEAPHIRFYAGYPIETPDGHRVGALCVLDTRPRRFSEQDAALLRSLAHQAQDRLWALGGEGSVDPVLGEAAPPV